MLNNLEALKKITNDITKKGFLDSETNIKAKEDFKNMCFKTKYSASPNVNFFTLKTLDNKYVGEFMVIGHDLSKKQANFPKELFDVENPNLYLAVVAYQNNNPVDVYVFKAAEFKKTGAFSMYKYDKTQDTYGVTISGGKLKQYSFGYVLKNIEGENK